MHLNALMVRKYQNDKLYPFKTKGFFSATKSLILYNATISTLSSACGKNGMHIAIKRKNIQMKISLKEFFAKNLKSWHLLAAIYGFITATGIIYRILIA